VPCDAYYCCLADLQKFLAAGARVSPALERATAAPANFDIAAMPQPSSAPQILYQNLQAQMQRACPVTKSRLTYRNGLPIPACVH